MTDSSSNLIAYIGPTGAGLGFQLAGLAVYEVDDSDKAVATLRGIIESGETKIIFVDEGLVENELEIVTKLNENPLPAIILLPNPVSPKHLSAANLQQLMVRAVGSDVFGSAP